MHTPDYVVNLDLPPRERWLFLTDHRDAVRTLLRCYLADFSGAEDLIAQVQIYGPAFVNSEYLEEIACVAAISGFTPEQVLVANLYYDILKFYLGCSAFALYNGKEVLHARNLDWHTDQNLLSQHSAIFDFQRNGKTVFKTVSWFGFIGALSGIRPGCFSLSLNAVSSDDPMEMAPPVSFLLRDVLTESESFNDAKRILEGTIIASDCLLLLSGVKPDELVVIERTPRRHATRTSTNGFIVVTNEYKVIQNKIVSSSVLQTTSCSRHDRAVELLSNHLPTHAHECLQILQDNRIIMGITVQQMVFQNTTGEVALIRRGVL